MRAKTLCLFIAGILLMGVLSACGSGAANSETFAQGTTSAADTVSPASGESSGSVKKTGGSSSSTGSNSTPPHVVGEPSASFRTPGGDNSIPNYGSEASDSQRAKATAALGNYLTARAKGDWASACSFMAATVRVQLETLAKASKRDGNGCVKAYIIVAGYGPPSERANPLMGGLAAFRVKGDKAFALFYGRPANQKYMYPMTSEGGQWKVNQIAPVAYPVGAPTKGG